MSTEPSPRRIGRLPLVLAALAMAGSTGFLTWWNTTLVGLPDVGDPFDVAAFSKPIPDATNAFVLYRQAAEIIPKEPEEPANQDWKTASPEQRRWLERSRKALAIWRTGTDRPDALYINPTSITFETRLDVAQTLRSFGRLALVEGSRLEEAGDFEGSLDWSLALLRCSRHCGRRGTMIERLIGVAMHRWASTRLIRWASEPKVDARLLRRALVASVAAWGMTPPTSEGLKVECLSLLQSINNPDLIVNLHDTDGTNQPTKHANVFGLGGWKSSLIRVRRRSINDPERSRRVILMIFANWLAYCDLPASERPPRALPSGIITTNHPARALLGDLFVVDSRAPAQARELPPEKLANWFATTMDAQLALPAWRAVEKAIAREQSAQDTLLFTLANELYQREHGAYPERNEALIGPYLERLPTAYQSPK